MSEGGGPSMEDMGVIPHLEAARAGDQHATTTGPEMFRAQEGQKTAFESQGIAQSTKPIDIFSQPPEGFTTLTQGTAGELMSDSEGQNDENPVRISSDAGLIQGYLYTDDDGTPTAHLQFIGNNKGSKMAAGYLASVFQSEVSRAGAERLTAEAVSPEGLAVSKPFERSTSYTFTDPSTGETRQNLTYEEAKIILEENLYKGYKIDMSIDLTTPDAEDVLKQAEKVAERAINKGGVHVDTVQVPDDWVIPHSSQETKELPNAAVEAARIQSLRGELTGIQTGAVPEQELSTIPDVKKTVISEKEIPELKERLSGAKHIDIEVGPGSGIFHIREREFTEDPQKLKETTLVLVGPKNQIDDEGYNDLRQIFADVVFVEGDGTKVIQEMEPGTVDHIFANNVFGSSDVAIDTNDFGKAATEALKEGGQVKIIETLTPDAHKQTDQNALVASMSQLDVKRVDDTSADEFGIIGTTAVHPDSYALVFTKPEDKGTTQQPSLPEQPRPEDTRDVVQPAATEIPTQASSETIKPKAIQIDLMDKDPETRVEIIPEDWKGKVVVEIGPDSGIFQVARARNASPEDMENTALVLVEPSGNESLQIVADRLAEKYGKVILVKGDGVNALREINKPVDQIDMNNVLTQPGARINVNELARSAQEKLLPGGTFTVRETNTPNIIGVPSEQQIKSALSVIGPAEVVSDTRDPRFEQLARMSSEGSYLIEFTKPAQTETVKSPETKVSVKQPETESGPVVIDDTPEFTISRNGTKVTINLKSDPTADEGFASNFADIRNNIIRIQEDERKSFETKGRSSYNFHGADVKDMVRMIGAATGQRVEDIASPSVEAKVLDGFYDRLAEIAQEKGQVTIVDIGADQSLIDSIKAEMQKRYPDVKIIGVAVGLASPNPNDQSFVEGNIFSPKTASTVLERIQEQGGNGADIILENMMGGWSPIENSTAETKANATRLFNGIVRSMLAPDGVYAGSSNDFARNKDYKEEANDGTVLEHNGGIVVIRNPLENTASAPPPSLESAPSQETASLAKNMIDAISKINSEVDLNTDIDQNRARILSEIEKIVKALPSGSLSIDQGKELTGKSETSAFVVSAAGIGITQGREENSAFAPDENFSEMTTLKALTAIRAALTYQSLHEHNSPVETNQIRREIDSAMDLIISNLNLTESEQTYLRNFTRRVNSTGVVPPEELAKEVPAESIKNEAEILKDKPRTNAPVDSDISTLLSSSKSEKQPEQPKTEEGKEKPAAPTLKDLRSGQIPTTSTTAPGNLLSTESGKPVLTPQDRAQSDKKSEELLENLLSTTETQRAQRSPEIQTTPSERVTLAVKDIEGLISQIRSNPDLYRNPETGYGRDRDQILEEIRDYIKKNIPLVPLEESEARALGGEFGTNFVVTKAGIGVVSDENGATAFTTAEDPINNTSRIEDAIRAIITWSELNSHNSDKLTPAMTSETTTALNHIMDKLPWSSTARDVHHRYFEKSVVVADADQLLKFASSDEIKRAIEALKSKPKTDAIGPQGLLIVKVEQPTPTIQIESGVNDLSRIEGEDAIRLQVSAREIRNILQMNPEAKIVYSPSPNSSPIKIRQEGGRIIAESQDPEAGGPTSTWQSEPNRRDTSGRLDDLSPRDVLNPIAGYISSETGLPVSGEEIYNQANQYQDYLDSFSTGSSESETPIAETYSPEIQTPTVSEKPKEKSWLSRIFGPIDIDEVSASDYQDTERPTRGWTPPVSERPTTPSTTQPQPRRKNILESALESANDARLRSFDRQRLGLSDEEMEGLSEEQKELKREQARSRIAADEARRKEAEDIKREAIRDAEYTQAQYQSAVNDIEAYGGDISELRPGMDPEELKSAKRRAIQKAQTDFIEERKRKSSTTSESKQPQINSRPDSGTVNQPRQDKDTSGGRSSEKPREDKGGFFGAAISALTGGSRKNEVQYPENEIQEGQPWENQPEPEIRTNTPPTTRPQSIEHPSVTNSPARYGSSDYDYKSPEAEQSKKPEQIQPVPGPEKPPPPPQVQTPYQLDKELLSTAGRSGTDKLTLIRNAYGQQQDKYESAREEGDMARAAAIEDTIKALEQSALKEMQRIRDQEAKSKN